jgi:hypothetical protein
MARRAFDRDRKTRPAAPGLDQAWAGLASGVSLSDPAVVDARRGTFGLMGWRHASTETVRSARGAAAERTADAVADAITGSSRGFASASSWSSPKRESDDASSPLVREALSSPGKPLEPQARGFMESRFGHDFGRIRIHDNDEAARAAESVHARSFAVGPHIAFAAREYQPATEAGRHLLSHELTHTLQQSAAGGPARLQRKPDEKAGETATPANDPELLLGQRLWREFPAGVTVTFYDDNEPEIARRALELAQRERAIASKKTGFAAADLEFGLAFPDSKFKIGATIPKLSAELKKATDKAGQPAGIQPLPDTGPTQIRSLTVFAHGTPTWCGISNSLTTGNAPALIKQVAPYLTSDVNLVLYACSVARGKSESEHWQKGTMEGGGTDSLGAMIRDALVEEGKLNATVWGHTTVGHTSRNWALRVFKASLGKGSAGVAFAGEDVFGFVERLIAKWDIDDAIAAAGHMVPEDKREAMDKKRDKDLEKAFYDCYRTANREKTYQGVSLAEQAPNYPNEVAQIINEYWENTFWPTRKTVIAQGLIKQFALPKVPPSGVPAAP